MSLESEVQALTLAANEQTAASQALAQEVAGKMKEIDDGANEVLNRVDNAIPTAVKSEMYQQLYLDPTNGNDSNSGKNAANAFQTLKGLIDSVPVGGTVCVRGSNDLVIDVNEPILAANKNIVVYLADCTLNLNATITLQGGSFKNYYTFKQVIQTVKFGFYHYSADIRVAVADLTPEGEAECLFKQSYTSGSVSLPGSHHSNVLFQGTVSDSVSQYYVFAPTYYKASMIVTVYAVTLGTNVALFDPVYATVQVGTKSVYLVGA